MSAAQSGLVLPYGAMHAVDARRCTPGTAPYMAFTGATLATATYIAFGIRLAQPDTPEALVNLFTMSIHLFMMVGDVTQAASAAHSHCKILKPLSFMRRRLVSPPSPSSMTLCCLGLVLRRPCLHFWDSWSFQLALVWPLAGLTTIT